MGLLSSNTYDVVFSTAMARDTLQVDQVGRDDRPGLALR